MISVHRILWGKYNRILFFSFRTICRLLEEWKNATAAAAVQYRQEHGEGGEEKEEEDDDDEKK